VEVIMWEQLGAFGRYTVPYRRRRGLVWFVAAAGTWRWEFWELSGEEPKEWGLVPTEGEARSAVESRCGAVRETVQPS